MVDRAFTSFADYHDRAVTNEMIEKGKSEAETWFNEIKKYAN